MMKTAEEIVRALARTEPLRADCDKFGPGHYRECNLCKAVGIGLTAAVEHKPECPYRLAGEWVEFFDRFNAPSGGGSRTEIEFAVCKAIHEIDPAADVSGVWALADPKQIGLVVVRIPGIRFAEPLNALAAREFPVGMLCDFVAPAANPAPQE